MYSPSPHYHALIQAYSRVGILPYGDPQQPLGRPFSPLRVAVRECQAATYKKHLSKAPIHYSNHHNVLIISIHHFPPSTPARSPPEQIVYHERMDPYPHTTILCVAKFTPMSLIGDYGPRFASSVDMNSQYPPTYLIPSTSAHNQIIDPINGFVNRPMPWVSHCDYQFRARLHLLYSVCASLHC